MTETSVDLIDAVRRACLVSADKAMRAGGYAPQPQSLRTRRGDSLARTAYPINIVCGFPGSSEGQTIKAPALVCWSP